MDLDSIQKYVVKRINDDEKLSAAGCRAVVEDKGDAFAEVNEALALGLCAIVQLPKWSPDSSAAKNAVGKLELVVEVCEVPALNRERPDAIHGLAAAQRVAWLINQTKANPDDPACGVLAIAPPGIVPSVQEDGNGVIYAVSFVQLFQLKG